MHKAGVYDFLDGAAEMYREAGRQFEHAGCRTILDIGCAHGTLIRHWGSYDAYTGIDISPYVIRRNRRLLQDRRHRWLQRDVFAPDAVLPRAAGVFLGGVLVYRQRPWEFVAQVVRMSAPTLIVIQDLQATPLGDVPYPVVYHAQYDFPLLDVENPERRKRQLLAIRP